MKLWNIFTADLANTNTYFCLIKNNKSELVPHFLSQFCDAVSHLEDMAYLAVGTQKQACCQ